MPFIECKYNDYPLMLNTEHIAAYGPFGTGNHEVWIAMVGGGENIFIHSSYAAFTALLVAASKEQP